MIVDVEVSKRADEDGRVVAEAEGSSARVVERSVSPTGVELVTYETTYPRPIHGEVMTHRVFSRNSASSRAIPVTKMIRRVLADPFVPRHVGRNEPGMSASTYLEGADYEEFRESVLSDRDQAVYGALEKVLGTGPTRDLLGSRGDVASDHSLLRSEEGADRVSSALDAYTAYTSESRRAGLGQTRHLDVHKQTANRYLEPFLFHTVIITGTEWSNFYALRREGNAQPEIQVLATLMGAALAESTAREVGYGEWHLPYVREDERAAAEADPETYAGVSAARSARVSFERHRGGGRTIEDETAFYRGLVGDGHASPAEHPATPLRPGPSGEEVLSGNFRGWRQLRKFHADEHDYSLVLARS